jgi:PAS domain S-box-containing protein
MAHGDRDSKDGIWTIDAEGITLYANEAMAALLQTTISGLLGQPSFDYIFPEDAPEAQRLFDAKRRGDTGPFEFRLRRRDGSALWVSIQGTPMHDEDGRFRGIIGTFRPLPQGERDRTLKSGDVRADM